MVGYVSKRSKKEFLERAKLIWQPYAQKALSDEDIRELTENIVGFFGLLNQWDKKEIITRDDPLNTLTEI
jgi:hypothetical protein